MRLHLVWAAVLVTALVTASSPAIADDCEATEADVVIPGADGSTLGYVLLGETLGSAWVYLESNDHEGLQDGATQVLGLYNHSPTAPAACHDGPDTLLL